MKALHMIAFLLLVVGGLNWLLVGVADIDLVMWLFAGLGDVVVRAAYILVGLSAVYLLFTHKKECTSCNAGSAM